MQTSFQEVVMHFSTKGRKNLDLVLKWR